MSDITLNETPVRTSRNFNINNIKLENITIPKNIGSFNNVYIENNSSKIVIDEDVRDIKLTYGVGKELTDITPNVTLKVMSDSNENKEASIDFKFDSKNTCLVDKINIILNENSISTVILKYETLDDIEYFHNLVLKIKANKNSKLNVIIINYMNLLSHNFMSIENDLYENAKVNYTIVDFGGKTSITNYYSNLNGKNSKNIINAIYLGKEEELFDLNYIGELRGEKSNIDIKVEGALKDKSKKHFKGTIDFKKGAKKAKGNENESCMLLSDTAKSISLPMLLCSEEDVEGNHSSSAGRIDKKELFYIMSRGFNEKEAMKLMIRAKFNKIIESIENNKIRDEIIQQIDKRLD